MDNESLEEKNAASVCKNTFHSACDTCCMTYCKEMFFKNFFLHKKSKLFQTIKDEFKIKYKEKNFKLSEWVLAAKISDDSGDKTLMGKTFKSYLVYFWNRELYYIILEAF